MIKNKKGLALRSSKGFTIVELLVVIAIIGILASAVLVSLGSARAKARDARRISDVKQIQNTLEVMYSDTNTYPDALPANVPKDPNGAVYLYGVSSPDKQHYIVEAALEQANSVTASNADPATYSIPNVTCDTTHYCVGL